MRLLLFCVFAAAAVCAVSAAPAACPSLPVELELRSDPSNPINYQLVFTSLDHSNAVQGVDFIDIHYRSVANSKRVDMCFTVATFAVCG